MSVELDLALPAGWSRAPASGRSLVASEPQRDTTLAFAASVVAGLSARPRRLDSTFLYDDEGSRIFEEITRQPEYYQTRTEAALLAQHAATVRDLVGPSALVELGSGSSSKTERLLDAWTERQDTVYAPVDVSRSALEHAIARLDTRYGDRLAVQAFAAAYDRALPLVSVLSPLTLAFLGSSIGNLGRHEQDEFVALLAASLRPGDHFLVGLDQAHDPSVLEAAYNDAAGWSARFTRNLFARMNRELGTNVPLDRIRHVAFYDEEHERIEIFAELEAEVSITIASLGRSFRLARGERIQTEVSRKYGPTVQAEIERHGFQLRWQALDERKRFGLHLYRRVANHKRPRVERAPDWAALEHVRHKTMAIIEPLAPAALERQHNHLMSPIVWDLGHLANFEEVWLCRRAPMAISSSGMDLPLRDEGLDPRYDPARTPRARRGELDLACTAETLAYMARVRNEAHETWDRIRPNLDRGGPLLEDAFVLALVAQHEAQHQETILQAIHLRDDLPYRPACAEADAPAPRRLPCDRVLVPGGPFLMGATDPDRTWAYDNERPAHLVDVPAFWIDVAPVTEEAFARFIEDGGYERAELWSPEGWRWAREEQVTAPLGWTREAGSWSRRSFSTSTPLDPRGPVVHVSWYEADAYARWAGKRLPSEAEWEKAAGWDPAKGVLRRHPWGDAPRPDCANLDLRHLAPAPVGAFPSGRSPWGCEQMLGDVWEWTASWFEPYPGFRPFPYRSYSEPFFGRTHRVLRGGSFATSSLVARTTFRNWDLPQRRQIFAGFRCAESA